VRRSQTWGAAARGEHLLALEDLVEKRSGHRFDFWRAKCGTTLLLFPRLWEDEMFARQGPQQQKLVSERIVRCGAPTSRLLCAESSTRRPGEGSACHSTTSALPTTT